MSESVQQPSAQDVLFSQLAELARTSEGANRFNVKVEFKDRAGSMPQLILGIKEVRLSEIVDCETWLSQLLGGTGENGQFILSVKHDAFKESSVAIGKVHIKVGGIPRWKANSRDFDINWAAADTPDWQGPRSGNIYFPTRAKPVASDDESFISIARGDVGSETGTPPPRRTTHVSSGSQFPNEAERLSAKAAEIDRRERNLEIEGIKRDASQQVKALESKLDTKLDALLARQQAPLPAVVQEKGPLISPEVAGIITTTITALMSRSEATARTQAETAIKVAEINAKAAESQGLILREALSKGDKAGESTAKMMEGMSRVMAQSADMSATMISSMTKLMMEVAEQMRPADDKDSELVKVMKVALGALGKMAPPDLRQLTQGAGGAGEQQQPGGEEELPNLPASVQPVEKMIFDMVDVKEVAKEIVRLAENDKDFIKLLGEYNNNVLELFDDYFGVWAEEDKTGKRLEYSKTLIEAIQGRVQERFAEKKAADAAAKTGVKT